MFRLFAIITVLIVAVGHSVPSMALVHDSVFFDGTQTRVEVAQDGAPVFKPCGKLSGKRSLLCHADHGLIVSTPRTERPWASAMLPIVIRSSGTAHEPQVDPRPPKSA